MVVWLTLWKLVQTYNPSKMTWLTWRTLKECKTEIFALACPMQIFHKMYWTLPFKPKQSISTTAKVRVIKMQNNDAIISILFCFSCQKCSWWYTKANRKHNVAIKRRNLLNKKTLDGDNKLSTISRLAWSMLSLT